MKQFVGPEAQPLWFIFASSVYGVLVVFVALVALDVIGVGP